MKAVNLYIDIIIYRYCSYVYTYYLFITTIIGRYISMYDRKYSNFAVQFLIIVHFKNIKLNYLQTNIII